MALNYDDPVVWGALYRTIAADPVTGRHEKPKRYVGYGKEFFGTDQERIDRFTRKNNLIVTALSEHPDATPPALADRILVAGCAQGYGIEAWQVEGYTQVYGIEQSNYIEQRRPTDGVDGVVYVKEDIRGGGGVRAALKRETGENHFAYVIDEDAISSYTDAEIPQLIQAMESVLTSGQPLVHCVHLVTTPITQPVDPVEGTPQNKTLAEWKAMAPNHLWVNARTGEWM